MFWSAVSKWSIHSLFLRKNSGGSFSYVARYCFFSLWLTTEWFYSCPVCPLNSVSMIIFMVPLIFDELIEVCRKTDISAFCCRKYPTILVINVLVWLLRFLICVQWTFSNVFICLWLLSFFVITSPYSSISFLFHSQYTKYVSVAFIGIAYLVFRHSI